MNIHSLGINEEEFNLYKTKEFKIARVISVNRESFIINDGTKEYFAKVTGNLMFSAESSLDFPTVGDFVYFQNFDDDSTAIIHKVLERKSLLTRKSPGKKIEFQLIAANVDFAIIIQALDNDFNSNRLERYLIMVNEFKIKPIIFLSKSDLLNTNEVQKISDKVKNDNPEILTYAFSSFNDDIENLRQIFKPKKTYCIIGSSGVGKTTFINKLLGEEKFQTNEVRKGDSKGKHTTTSRQLVILENGAMIIDTPGMRELGNISANDGIEKTFDEITSLIEQCQFSDCTHTVEKGCAVLEAVKNNQISEKRYSNFIKLRKESEYYERSYVEKRKRDKEFGKMIKSVLKEHKTRKR